MKKLASIIGATLLVAFTAVSGAQALTINLVQNGDFETGGGSLAGWTTSGAVGIWTDGSNHMATLGMGPHSGLSLISQTFTIGLNNTNQRLAFDYNFRFVDQSRQIDIFAAIVNGSEQVHLASFDTAQWVSDHGHQDALLIPQLGAGTYALMFQLNEASDSSGQYNDSMIKLDNIALTANVPEPGTLLLLGSGLLGMAAFGRRRFNK